MQAGTPHKEAFHACECGLTAWAGPMKRHRERCWTPKTLDRIFELCGVTQGDPDECWLATKTMNSSGYPRISIGGGKRIRASHAVVEVTTGLAVVKPDIVLHACDTPPCLNPKCLSTGTQTDNMIDMKHKGRNWPLKGTKKNVNE